MLGIPCIDMFDLIENDGNEFLKRCLLDTFVELQAVYFPRFGNIK